MLIRTLISVIILLRVVEYAPPPTVHGKVIPEKMSTTRQKVMVLYNSQIGIREQGNNSGPEVEKYLSYVKLPKGNPWCAAFVCWVLGSSGVENPGSGWSPALFPVSKLIWSRKTNARAHIPSQLLSAGKGVASTALPLSGDVFGLYFPEKGRIAHAGFVDEWQDTWVITVEGNTNDAGSREGDGVYKKRRLKSSLYQVARYIPD